MIFSNGTPNEMKQVLLERRVNVSKMKAAEIRTSEHASVILSSYKKPK